MFSCRGPDSGGSSRGGASAGDRPVGVARSDGEARSACFRRYRPQAPCCCSRKSFWTHPRGRKDADDPAMERVPHEGRAAELHTRSGVYSRRVGRAGRSGRAGRRRYAARRLRDGRSAAAGIGDGLRGQLAAGHRAYRVRFELLSSEEQAAAIAARKAAKAARP